MYYYLAISDYIISTSSTVAYEATRFGGNILILRCARYFYSHNLVETGIATYVDSMDDVIEYVGKHISNRKESEYYYAKNSCQLFYNAIDDILEKNKERRDE